ncbi:MULTISPECIES: hybrid sensor histidine kinase/response regulator [unclassified Alcanivorax]|nr:MULTISPECIES: hybrid sensor histidine kinase/response regulator [unclassified Alcanivorax]
MAENARLSRICDALIERVEASNMAPTAPYAAFQHSVVLAEQVRERTQDLRDVNQKLLEEIEERRHIEMQLREAREKAEQANLSKTRFVAAVSHDLMQPLNAARLFTSALQEKPENMTFQLAHISTALTDLESLITTLSDASKLDAGVVTAELEVFPLSRLLDVLAEEFRQIAQQKGLRFRYVPCASLVRSDSQLLSRILRNLLSNAVRYTESGSILLGCRKRDEGVEVVVTDTGIGIRDDQHDEIFKEFKRGKQAVRHHERGLGLGLAIVEKISDILSHPLRFHSQDGKGSSFGLLIPIAEPEAYIRRALSEDPFVDQSLQGLRIWVVDNDEAICIGMQTLMEGWGCDVVVADSLASLRSKVDTGADDADVLLMDYHLDPGTDDGITVATFINSGRQIPLPVMLVTADRSAELKQRCIQNGFMQIYKPLKPLKLKMALKNLSGRLKGKEE